MYPTGTSCDGHYTLDAIEDRLMHRLQYRNRGGFETLVLTHTVGAPGSDGFWNLPSRWSAITNFAALCRAEFRGAGTSYFCSSRRCQSLVRSAAEDHQGNLAVGYSVSSGAAGGNVLPECAMPADLRRPAKWTDSRRSYTGCWHGRANQHG
jgi:hypothetical protein